MENNLSADFDGKTYVPADDRNRLKRQLHAVFALMRDSSWRTLEEISSQMGIPASTASISARLRDFRKEKFGRHTVNRRLRDGKKGLFEYQLITNTSEVV
jgi:hypothetical protein